jgi:excisionase family DNA binding protein
MATTGDGFSFLSVTEAARLLGMSSDNIRYHARQGRLHGIKVGNQHIFFKHEIERFKQQRDVEASGRGAVELAHV